MAAGDMGRFAASEAFPSCRFVFVAEIKKPRGETRGRVGDSMHRENNSTSAPASSEKRDPGFARIRKGFLAHLPGMSGNGVKLYLMLQFKACWFGAKRGWVEASFDDMARWCGWSTKTLQRNLEELETKPYIEIERAANQHELTRIKILKYDLEESTSAADKSDRSSTVGVDCALDRALDSAVDSAADKPVHSKPATLQNPQDLQAPKKLKEVKEVKEQKKETANAVRRRFDAERLADRTPPFKEKLQNRLEKKIESTNDSYPDWIKSCRKRGEGHPFGAKEQKAFEATGYEPDLSSPLLGFDFVTTVVDVYEETRKKDISPGNLCSRIIDRCQSERGRNDVEGYYWPPDFQDHRDRLRVQERARELMNANKAGHTGGGLKP